MIDLYTAPTPNGYKISICLEELGLDYQAHPINLLEEQQKEDWFLAINPNGRIPAIIDHDQDDLKLFESGAILLYLAEKTGKLLPIEPKARAQCIQWLIFQVAGIGPMQGQAQIFKFAAPEKIPYAIKRYVQETMRLYRVLDQQLFNQEYICGSYSIADIACWPWVRLHAKLGINLKDMPHLKAWIYRLNDRPALQRGILVPQGREWPELEGS